MPPLEPREARRQRIVEGLRGRGLDQAVADPTLFEAMKQEAESDASDRLVTPDLVALAEQARAVRGGQPSLGLFSHTDDVILIPGLLGSELVEVEGPDGLIWVDPSMLLVGTKQLLQLRLGELPTRPAELETDFNPGVKIQPHGAVPVIYTGLKYGLEIGSYSVQIFGFDWRKDIEESAGILAALIRTRAGQKFRPLHIVAHSQGTIVARRAIQLVGAELGRRLVSNLVLLGPATAGSFASAMAIAGAVNTLESFRRYGLEPPDGFAQVLQSMTGLYQLLPWRADPVDDRSSGDKALQWVKEHAKDLTSVGFWETGVDQTRLEKKYGWGRMVDASFLNDRTTIILGDQEETPGGVKFVGRQLVPDDSYNTRGDGTVPDSLARLEGVSKVFKARGAAHMMLPATLSVISAVRDVLAGHRPRIETVPFGAAEAGVPFLAVPQEWPEPAPRSVAVVAASPGKPPAQPPGPPRVPAVRPASPAAETLPWPAPQNRRLRVFSFDPLYGSDLEALGTEYLTLELPWDFADGDHLQPGPVGEYLEVVDVDPASQLFYPPVDLNHPHLLAQDGLLASEGDPRFHQQMAYAVAMATIHRFEHALGRKALWGQHLRRDADGEVVPGQKPEDQYVQRLRIYPHALRQANAYFQPDLNALMLGYFQAQGADVGRNLPGGMVFASLSYDIIAHETTHALLHGLHRYLIEPSNPDVFAFHEAFADIVAMFQHFSHPEVLIEQLRRSRGDLAGENQLGVLAAQFGEAMGNHGALRSYLGERVKDPDGADTWRPKDPDPSRIHQESEPHARGAILVAALFLSFKNIYEYRVRDLRRIASGGTGILPDGDLHPDLVGRLAQEAAKAASHMLTMSVRALDYVPPVDITFGEYLRALMTADYDLVRDDDLHYRVAVMSAFRDWGIYPSDVRSMSVDSLLWCPPELYAFQHPIDLFRRDPRGPEADPGGPQGAGSGDSSSSKTGRRSAIDWNLRTDRFSAFVSMQDLKAEFHRWLLQQIIREGDRFLGLFLDSRDQPPSGDKPGEKPNPYRSIRRKESGQPVVEIHHVRPCRRIGPDGQQREDIVIEIVQRRKAFFDPERQRQVDFGELAYDDPKARPDFYFRGGCTLVVDPESGDVRYCIRKSITQDQRLDRERRFRQGQFSDPSAGAYFTRPEDGNPFAFLHSGF